MDLNKIEDSEMLYRVVRKTDPGVFISGIPTAALFMSDDGISVDRDGGRSEEQIITKFKNRFHKNEDYQTAVKISAGICRKIKTYPNPIGNHKNPYHAEIWDSKDKKRISLAKAMQLADLCTEVRG